MLLLDIVYMELAAAPSAAHSFYDANIKKQDERGNSLKVIADVQARRRPSTHFIRTRGLTLYVSGRGMLHWLNVMKLACRAPLHAFVRRLCAKQQSYRSLHK